MGSPTCGSEPLSSVMITQHWQASLRGHHLSIADARNTTGRGCAALRAGTRPIPRPLLDVGVFRENRRRENRVLDLQVVEVDFVWQRPGCSLDLLWRKLLVRLGRVHKGQKGTICRNQTRTRMRAIDPDVFSGRIGRTALDD